MCESECECDQNIEAGVCDWVCVLARCKRWKPLWFSVQKLDLIFENKKKKIHFLIPCKKKIRCEIQIYETWNKNLQIELWAP